MSTDEYWIHKDSLENMKEMSELHDDDESMFKANLNKQRFK